MKPCPALLLLAALSLAPPLLSAQTTAGCDLVSRKGGAGPFDYRNQRQMLAMVERRHFTTPVEQLVRGESTSQVGADIEYTLNKFPNHHRVLLALVRYGKKLKTDRPSDLSFSISCHFERALAFRRDDTLVRIIYATHLQELREVNGALAQLEMALQSAGDNPMTHMNIGMVYFDLGRFDEALQAAHRAQALGRASDTLRKRLEEAGKWREAKPPEAAASAASQAASQATPPASAASQ